jgi:hypothetical protein
MNILIKKWREAEVNTSVGVKGKWKVEIVCPNGEIKKPLGDEWRPNMIQDRGLNLLQGQTNVGSNSGLTHASAYGGLAHTINGALYGYDRPINIYDQNATSYNNQLQSTSANTAASSKVTRPCSFETDTINGSRTIKKIYDFNAVPLAQQIREVGIAQISLPSNTSFAVGSLGSNINVPIFSRFLIPGDGITLEQFQFLRLTYSLQMTVSATVNAVPIAVTSNGFDGTGQLKCVGSFDNLFGKINGDGSPVAGYSDIPWAIIGRNPSFNSTVPGCAAALISVELVNNAWTTPNFSNVNTDFAPQNVIAGTSINASSPGSSTTPASVNTEQLNLSGPSVSKEATLLFPASNPAAGAYIGGIFFRSRPDSMPSVPNAGWYWKFTDGSFNNQPQYKDPNYALAINVSQTITRI